MDKEQTHWSADPAPKGLELLQASDASWDQRQRHCGAWGERGSRPPGAPRKKGQRLWHDLGCSTLQVYILRAQEGKDKTCECCMQNCKWFPWTSSLLGQ